MFFCPPTKKWRLRKIFAKLNGNHLMANIFKLHEYQTFGFMKMHNMNKIWLANNKFSLLKSLVYDQRVAENAIFQFLPFSVFQISNDYCQKSYGKTMDPFFGSLFHNGWTYWYECWRVLRDFCGLSKKCDFATFPKI